MNEVDRHVAEVVQLLGIVCAKLSPIFEQAHPARAQDACSTRCAALSKDFGPGLPKTQHPSFRVRSSTAPIQAT